MGSFTSIVLVSLSAARKKANDASIKEEVHQMRVLLEENMNDYGSYGNLQTGRWVDLGSTNTCASAIPSGNGSYAAQALQICNNIMSQESGTPLDGISSFFYLGTNVGAQKYSILTWLPGQQIYWCAGSSGVSTDPGSWNSQGCYANP